ncbi:hypothetical protein PR048_011737 [Dryococelus australis]|uniref:Integrase catalytic domain-containing protein n=1 Tax=Dryococelus australis TaxID=614101 RepID=A0ABQ9HMD5_9NEOP|nr:hypothetical protein PR048_011737 [Dryococelus australis]
MSNVGFIYMLLWEELISLLHDQDVLINDSLTVARRRHFAVLRSREEEGSMVQPSSGIPILCNLRELRQLAFEVQCCLAASGQYWAQFSPPRLVRGDVSPDVLGYVFHYKADASYLALGTVLSQRTELGLAIVSLASCSLSEVERKLGIYEREALACGSVLEKCAHLANVGQAVVEIPEAPWSTVLFDIFGPLIHSEYGNFCGLILLDNFPKFVILSRLRNMKASAIVKGLTKQVCKVFWAPVEILTDIAKYYTSNFLKDMCFHWAIQHFPSDPYYPKGNQVEMLNRNLKACLTIL